MTTRRRTTRRVKREISNAGVPPQDNQDPTVMRDGEIREAFLNLTQVMATQAQVVTTQAQAMMAQANQEVLPCGNQSASTMASRLRDFTKMNPPSSLGLR